MDTQRYIDALKAGDSPEAIVPLIVAEAKREAQTAGPLSRHNEPPVGTWVKDRFGATSYRQKVGWGQPGTMPYGIWTAMWDARGPYEVCGPWGAPLNGERE